MNKKTIADLDLKNKRVLMRVDFNVPIDDQGRVGDDTRITAALPSIRHALEQGAASLVLMSHLGRPKGEVKPEFTLKPVAERLAELLGQDVVFAPGSVGEEVEALQASLPEGGVMLLENLRFHPEEEGKKCTEEEQEAFAAGLAKLGDVYVNDAFGTAHRAHASMAVVTKHIEECAAGYLLQKELEYLGRAIENPERPFLAIIGGAKISGKIDVVINLLNKVDSLIIGGGMAYTFFLAKGGRIGNSLVEEDKVDLARDIMKQAEEKGVNLLLPVDTKIADDFSESANTKVASSGEIEDGWEGLDIGPESIELFCSEIKKARTVVWNGPMGCFEMAPFALGTNTLAQTLADTDCISIVGGGDSVSAVKKAGLSDRISHISTGGGASLEFLEGKTLPGVAALSDR